MWHLPADEWNSMFMMIYAFVAISCNILHRPSSGTLCHARLIETKVSAILYGGTVYYCITKIVSNNLWQISNRISVMVYEAPVDALFFLTAIMMELRNHLPNPGLQWIFEKSCKEPFGYLDILKPRVKSNFQYISFNAFQMIRYEFSFDRLIILS